MSAATKINWITRRQNAVFLAFVPCHTFFGHSSPSPSRFRSLFSEIWKFYFHENVHFWLQNNIDTQSVSSKHILQSITARSFLHLCFLFCFAFASLDEILCIGNWLTSSSTSIISLYCCAWIKMKVVDLDFSAPKDGYRVTISFALVCVSIDNKCTPISTNLLVRIMWPLLKLHGTLQNQLKGL